MPTISSEALRLYRAEHPRSRATNWYTYYGSTGVVRRATCVACGTCIATCAAKWRETQAFRKAIDEHLPDCEAWQEYERRAADPTLVQLDADPDNWGLETHEQAEKAAMAMAQDIRKHWPGAVVSIDLLGHQSYYRGADGLDIDAWVQAHWHTYASEAVDI